MKIPKRLEETINLRTYMIQWSKDKGQKDVERSIKKTTRRAKC